MVQSDEADPVARWSTAAFVRLVPGTTSATWLRVIAPRLVELGVLRKIGKAWYGRRSAIEAALLTPPARAQGTRGRKSA